MIRILTGTLSRPLFIAAFSFTLWIGLPFSVVAGPSLTEELQNPLSGLKQPPLLAADKSAGVLAPIAEEIFPERPHRSWPIYYHRKFSGRHERSIFGPLWLYERTNDVIENYPLYPLWPLLGYTTRGGELTRLDIVGPFMGYQHHSSGEREYNLLWPFTGYSSTAGTADLGRVEAEAATCPDTSRPWSSVIRVT